MGLSKRNTFRVGSTQNLDLEISLACPPFRAKGLNMRYVAAYMLASLGGNASPSESDLKDILESVGVSFDQERASIVIAQLKGKDINTLIAEGAQKMASVPAGGAATAGASAGGAAAAEPEPEKKEEKKEESEEESDDDMGFGLFD